MRKTLILFIIIANIGCTQCNNIFKSIFSPSECQTLDFSFTKTRLTPAPPAACSAVTKSRKLAINCSPTSGSLGLCTSGSTGSNFYFIFLPNNNNGTFIDSTAGLINNCSDLWNALGSTTPPSDIFGGYFSSLSNGDMLSCTDSGGCVATSGSCISGWDASTLQPNGTTLSIPISTQLLVCGFIDPPINAAPPGGAPPLVGSGVPSISTANSFYNMSVSGTLNFNAWMDY